MKLILSLTLLWALCSTAGALQCQTCLDLTCSSTALQTCTTETMCLTATIQANASQFSLTQILKGCVAPSLCPNGSQISSSNFGFTSSVASSKCCNTDNCNTETLTIPLQTNNNLQCFACNANGTDCSTKLQCMGTQDRCFSANFTVGNISTPIFGCVSADTCDSLTNPENLMFFQNVTANFTSGPSCCSSNLCNKVFAANDACSFRLTVLHLLLGLLLLVLY